MSKTYLDHITNKEDNDDLSVTYTVSKTDEITSETYRKQSIDLFLPLSDRLHSLTEYYKLESEAVGELISSIIGMYFFSRTKSLADYLHAISALKSIPLLYRIECSKNVENGYTHIDDMFMNEASEMATLPTPIRIDTAIFLIKKVWSIVDYYKESSREYFCHIILDSSIDSLYRYRTIQSLENVFSKDNKEAFLYYTKEACIRFMQKEPTFTYRVIVCQYLLEKCSPDSDMVEEIQSFLLSTAENPTLADDVRADACDIILQYCDEASRSRAQSALFVLGGQDRNNIFKNKQNVHVRSIEESVEKVVNELTMYHPRSGTHYTFDQARDTILEITKDNTNKKDIEGALIRISIDRAVYGKSNTTLMGVLAKIWTYIQDSEYREDLEGRLLEELTESNDKCSSGYVARLVNTLSGYDDKMSITISFEDQIVANLEGRLNHAITNLDDSYETDLIIEEMSIPVINFHLRGNFLRFFRENISQIREQMYNEFHEFMEDVDFDFYFRKAIIHYEGCR
jgi:hypothetical protein